MTTRKGYILATRFQTFSDAIDTYEGETLTKYRANRLRNLHERIRRLVFDILQTTEHEPDTGPGPSNTVDCSNSE